MISLEEKYQLRKLYEKNCELCDVFENAGYWPYSGKMEMKQTLLYELFRFCHYLAASDGRVSQSEVAFLGTVLDVETSIDEMIDFIKENSIYSEEFESTVPLVIRGATSGQQKFYRQTGEDINIASSICTLFAEIGKAFVNCDGIDDSEVSDFKIYMGTIKDYIRLEEMNNISF